MPLISVALCTYNGGKYLQEQLDSLAQQSLLPAELVVCDDQSQDNTWAILEQFAQQAPFPVHLYQNPVRLGVSGNFGRAISLCQQEYIALADQDDVWFPQKLATTAAHFTNRPEVDAFFSDALIVDSHLKPLGYTLWQSVGFTTTLQQIWQTHSPLSLLLKQDIVTGATLVFKRHCLPLILPIPAVWMHDAWVATLLAATTKIEYINQSLIYYRQHAQQQIGGQKRSFINLLQHAQKTKTKKYDQRVLKNEQLLERLKQYQGEMLEKNALLWLENRSQHFKCRSQLPPFWFRRLFLILQEMKHGRYHQFSAGWSSAVKDLLWGYD